MTRIKKFLVSTKQIHLPMMGDMRARAIPLERRAIGYLSIVAFTFMALYVYFIAASVFHTVARQEMARENNKIEGEIASLEASYFSTGGRITEAYARSLGYVPPAASSFIERGSLTVAR